MSQNKLQNETNSTKFEFTRELIDTLRQHVELLEENSRLKRIQIEAECQTKQQLQERINCVVQEQEMARTTMNLQRHDSRSVSELTTTCVNFVDGTLDTLDEGVRLAQTTIAKEMQKLREKRLELLVDDGIDVKPYHEVEDATKEINRTIKELQEMWRKKEETKHRKLDEDLIQLEDLRQQITQLKSFNAEVRETLDKITQEINKEVKEMKLESSSDCNKNSKQYQQLEKEVEDLTKALEAQKKS